MNTDDIVEIGIDKDGRLFVRPRTQDFEFIYRAAAEVNWDDKNKVLISPKPKEESYFDWFRQIISVVKDEYGCKLNVTADTRWSNVPDVLRQEIGGR